MESSEDDAGTATSASRRVSAREKDVGLAENVDPTRNIQHESSEARASCDTPAMSEDNFDGDSVPSPSTKDTSTEAILDMIDDFIDGPGALRRLPLVSQSNADLITPVLSAPVDLASKHETEVNKVEIAMQFQEPLPAASGDSENVSQIDPLQPAEVVICEPTEKLSPKESELETTTMQVIVTEPNSAESDALTQQLTLDPLPNKTVQPIVSLLSSSGPDVILEQQPTSSLSSLEQNVLTDQSTIASSSVEQEMLIDQPIIAALPRNIESEVLTEQPCIPPTSSSTEQKVSIEQCVITPSSSYESTVSKDEPAIPSTSSSVESKMSKDLHSLSDLETRASIEQLVSPLLSSIKPGILQEPIPAPTSSCSATVQVLSDTSECKNVERTVKCVTSNETSDSVTVELAESTSSECSVSESKPLSVDSVSLSPLKRRLIRPALNDRRPDSTVSSTVDSQTTDIRTMEQTICENITKDVSSSSDAVPHVHGSTKPEEISNVSEISICKAETSTAPARKIKLVRPKVIPVISCSVKNENQKSPAPLHKDQCQSTSSEICIPSAKPSDICSRSVLDEDHERLQLCKDIDNNSVKSLKLSEQPKDSPIIQIMTPQLTKNPEVLKVPQEQIGGPFVSDIHVPSGIDVPAVVNKSEVNVNNEILDEKKVSCEKLAISDTKLTETKTKNTLESHIIFIDNLKESQKSFQEVTSKLSPSAIQVLESEIPMRVPPIKLHLNSPDNSKNSEVLSGHEKPKLDNEESKTIKLDMKQVPKLTIKLTNKHTDENSPVPKVMIKPSPTEQIGEDIDTNQASISVTKSISNENCSEASAEEMADTHTNQLATKLNIKPKSPEEGASVIKIPPPPSEQSHNFQNNQQIPSVAKINIKPIVVPAKTDKGNENVSKSFQSLAEQNDDHDRKQEIPSVKKINIKPILKPIEKTRSKPVRPPPTDEITDDSDMKHQIPCITKLNIKPIVNPAEKANEDSLKSHTEIYQNDLVTTRNKQIPSVTKLYIKPIVKPPEKINEIHRKSSSSEISESECSENDESTSTSDQASASDQGPLDTIPKVTIKLGKPGTESEGKFYTEQNMPKLSIKNVHHSERDDQDMLVIHQSDDKQVEKVPKITIKTLTKPDSQPLSPKLTIKPLKPPENVNKDNEVPKLKISTTELFSSNTEVKENCHVPKITIKPVTKCDADGAKTPKKSAAMCDSSEHIPVVTKLNIKPVLKPTESGDSSESYDEKVPVVSKLNIKPIIKPKDNDVDSSIEDVPKIMKLNIKPLKNPEKCSSEEKDCDEKNDDMKDNSSIPVVTKINIKPIVKPVEDEALKDSENQSSETGNSSDDNADHIPMVTKLNIKPIVKPNEFKESANLVHTEQNIPVVTKLNIKPIVKPVDSSASCSPKKESMKCPGNASIPVVTKLNIKPIVKPEELCSKTKEDNVEKSNKNPSLVMKINMKNVSESKSENEYLCNNISGKAHSPKLPNSPKATKRSKESTKESNSEMSSKPKIARIVESKNTDCHPDSPSLLQTDCQSLLENSLENDSSPQNLQKSISNEHHAKDQKLSKTSNVEKSGPEKSVLEKVSKCEPSSLVDVKINKKNAMNESHETNRVSEHLSSNFAKSQNYTLLKKLLSTTKEEKLQVADPINCISPQSEKSESTLSCCNDTSMNEEKHSESQTLIPKTEKTNDLKQLSESVKIRPIHDIHKEANESVTKPLEIITDKITNQGSGQDSPRIILKINKTDNGASAKILTEEVHKPTDCSPSTESHSSDHIEDRIDINDIPSPKKHLMNSRRKPSTSETSTNVTIGKRLRSSRIVESAEKSPPAKRNVNKKASTSDTSSTTQHKESEVSVHETKRNQLEQLLSVNKSLTITPVVSKITQTSPSKSTITLNQAGKVSHNHSLLNNDNCTQKNGNSKLHNILSNLQAKQMQTLQLNDSKSEKATEITTEVESTASTESTNVVVEITRVENCHPEVQEMIINENSVCDLTETDEVSQDPLEVQTAKPVQEEAKETTSIATIELTPTPRKRGRPRKLPLAENSKPSTPSPLPVPALEERPQRSLRLMRERPAILRKPRGGRGRGRGSRRQAASAAAGSPRPEPPSSQESEPVAVVDVVEERPPEPIDPTSSRIKLPRMTEALDKSVAGCTTPLTSRRRSSAASTELKLFNSAAVLDSPLKDDEFMKSPEATRPKSGRGSRGGRGRTPRNRGRGRGGGRGAMYMKETMGIYGRVCGPATTTVQLFEEETCMMDDNATPSKPSHLLDEDSQSSIKSSTNDSNKMRKSKFADLFDSNKVWTAADVKEYMWPPPDTPDADPQVMMIQEQVAMFLGVKSFKRRYPELKRRTVGGDERTYILSKGVVSEALCELGITAVDASEVLDIMLSDYPHKYEEYRTHQRDRHIASLSEETTESKSEDRPTKAEVKAEKALEKPEPPKVDPEKTRQDMAAAAIASAAEWNARANACRRPACVDLQSMTVHRRRALPPRAPLPPPRVRPPHGFYPHALLPGQFQHWYRTYTSEQLRYFPLNTVLAAPPAPPSPAESCSESDGSWGEHSSSSDDSDGPQHHSAKRKKLSRAKRTSQQDKDKEDSRGPEAEVDLCRVCKLRLEANRKYTHERFLVCANCNAKLHPGCVELPADTIRKCREYPWQCAECKSCCACRQPKDDDKMLFCDLCDRGFHIYCVGLDAVPSGRWHCVECAICKSCGARDPNGLTPGVSGTPGTSNLSTPGPSTPGPSTSSLSTPGPSTPGVSSGPGEWHHQTRRGPGGHKVYSHSLCTPCARAYRIGRYCPLCDRSFIGPKGTMQLVICKLCDRQLHQECVRATVAHLKVLDYTCADCRRGGITSRAAAVRVAPRTIATLFMAKRRFNKYAHRQYLQSRLQAIQDADGDTGPGGEGDTEPPPADDECSVDPLEGAGDAPQPAPDPDDSVD